MLKKLILLSAAVATAAQANDWEKFYKAVPTAIPLERSSQTPEVLPMRADMESLVDEMWQNGYAALGYTYFNSPNASTRDAVKLGTKLGARYIALATQLTSSSTTSIPMTTPTTTTSYTNGTASAFGSGGMATGTYQGTTTTYGSKTTYTPITIERFDKGAVYFSAVPRKGIGILTRELTKEEVAKYETQRAIAVRAVRKDSPAYMANILPGDIILALNGEPASLEGLKAALGKSSTFSVHLYRNGTERNVSVTVPDEWRPNF